MFPDLKGHSLKVGKGHFRSLILLRNNPLKKKTEFSCSCFYYKLFSVFILWKYQYLLKIDCIMASFLTQFNLSIKIVERELYRKNRVEL